MAAGRPIQSRYPQPRRGPVAPESPPWTTTASSDSESPLTTDRSSSTTSVRWIGARTDGSRPGHRVADWRPPQSYSQRRCPREPWSTGRNGAQVRSYRAATRAAGPCPGERSCLAGDVVAIDIRLMIRTNARPPRSNSPTVRQGIRTRLRGRHAVGRSTARGRRFGRLEPLDEGATDHFSPCRQVAFETSPVIKGIDQFARQAQGNLLAVYPRAPN